MDRAINLIGQTFDRLTVVSRGPNAKNRSAQWYCQCSCGNKNLVLIRGDRLKSGNTKSCGCLQKEAIKKIGKNNKKYNTFDIISQDYAIGYTTKGEEFWFDKEDLSRVSKYCWFYTNNGYLSAWDENRNEHILLHRLIMGVFDKKLYDIDHIHHPPRNEHKVDNRKCNLRIVTQSQNNMNQCVKEINNSGCTGVYFDTSREKWVATIKINYKNIHLGRFNNLEDAMQARIEAEDKYFGEYRYRINN